MAGSCTPETALANGARLCLAVFAATLVLSGSDARANGGPNYDLRFFPTVGKPTTTFRITFTAPRRTNGEDTDYWVEGAGPRRCPLFFDILEEPKRPGDRVAFRLSADDFYIVRRTRWCRGAYVAVIYWSSDERDEIVGYVRFGVGRGPVSLEP